MRRIVALSVVPFLLVACGSEDSGPGNDGCSGSISYWQDADGDGFGSPATHGSACEVPPGTVDNGDDCDDTSDQVHPGVDDDCNGIDDDCDGDVDSKAPVWYADSDGDGFGAPGGARTACERPDGYVSNDGDCDDSAAGVHPGATEVCNSIDDNCVGGVDEEADADKDGHDSQICGGDDCDDLNSDVYPGAHDTCADGVDNDCENGDSLCGSFAGEVDLEDSDAKVVSENGNEEVGRLLDIGDVNADGVPDVLAAAEYMNNHGGGYILYGPLSGDHVATDEGVGYKISAGSGDSYTGRSISVGDIDGDGVDDLGFGAPYSAEVFVQFGPVTENISLTDASLHARGVDALFGHGHDIADMNDDGQDDLVIGSYCDSSHGYSNGGAIFINYGPLEEGTIEPADDYDAVLYGFENTQYAGRIVRAGGDFNGDGVQDMMIQAFGYSHGAPSAGAAFVVFGPVVDEETDLEDSNAILAGESPSSWSAHSISHGDINNDGITDALVGAPYSNIGVSGSGSGYVVLGPITGTVDLGDSDVIVRGSTTSAMAGNCMSAGDVNKDSYDDLLVGAPGDNTGGTGAGAAYFYYGPLEGTVDGDDADALFYGESNQDQAGMGLFLADLDLDGGADLLISSPYDSTSGSQGGAVYVVYGSEE